METDNSVVKARGGGGGLGEGGSGGRGMEDICNSANTFFKMVAIAIRSCSPNYYKKNNKLNTLYCPMSVLQTIFGIKDPSTKIEGQDGS